MKTGVLKLFTIIGLALLLGAGYCVYNVKQFKKSAIQTNGTVIELKENITKKDGKTSRTFTPVVRYKTAKGEEFTMTSSISSNPPAYTIGETATILYIEDNPENARIDSFASNWMAALILGAMGLTLFLIGTISLRGKSNAAYLKQQGIKVVAIYNGVELNTTYKVNHRSPFRIVCQWQNPLDSKIFIFYSENLWFNPEPYIDRKQIDVYVKPGNYKKYTVDVSFLPELA